jgi:long-chain acyl-CoA synthetase
VAEVNRVLPDAARIDRFALLYKELDADDAELTRTGKVRRGAVAEHFREIIEAMHAGRDAVAIDTTIDLQDGKSTRIQTTVRVRNIR